MTIIKQPTTITKTEFFINQINNLYSILKSNHTQLMNIWVRPQEEILEILNGLGTDAKSIFEASSTIQGLLKAFDNSYEIIYPYKIVIENGERNKVLLQVNFNQDGSFKELVEK